MVYIKSYNPEPEIVLGLYPVISGKARIVKSELGAYTELRSYVS